MKRTLFLLTLFAPLFAAAQKTELRVFFNTGLSWYAGGLTTPTSALYVNGRKGEGQTGLHFSSNPTPSYGLAIGFDRVARSGFFFGVNGGPELMRSRQQINVVVVEADAGPPTVLEADGHTVFTRLLLNAYPHAGWRLPAGAVTVDVAAGVDLAAALTAWEHGSATATDGQRYAVSGQRLYFPQSDARLRLQAGVNYRRYGLYAGYSAGWVDQRHGLFSSREGACVRYLRIGLSHRF